MILEITHRLLRGGLFPTGWHSTLKTQHVRVPATWWEHNKYLKKISYYIRVAGKGFYGLSWCLDVKRLTEYLKQHKKRKQIQLLTTYIFNVDTKYQPPRFMKGNGATIIQ